MRLLAFVRKILSVKIQKEASIASAFQGLKGIFVQMSTNVLPIRLAVPQTPHVSTVVEVTCVPAKKAFMVTEGLVKRATVTTVLVQLTKSVLRRLLFRANVKQGIALSGLRTIVKISMNVMSLITVVRTQHVSIQRAAIVVHVILVTLAMERFVSKVTVKSTDVPSTNSVFLRQVLIAGVEMASNANQIKFVWT